MVTTWSVMSTTYGTMSVPKWPTFRLIKDKILTYPHIQLAFHRNLVKALNPINGLRQVWVKRELNIRICPKHIQKYCFVVFARKKRTTHLEDGSTLPSHSCRLWGTRLLGFFRRSQTCLASALYVSCFQFPPPLSASCIQRRSHDSHRSTLRLWGYEYVRLSGATNFPLLAPVLYGGWERLRRASSWERILVFRFRRRTSDLHSPTHPLYSFLQENFISILKTPKHCRSADFKW